MRDIERKIQVQCQYPGSEPWHLPTHWPRPPLRPNEFFKRSITNRCVGFLAVGHKECHESIEPRAPEGTVEGLDT